MSTGALWIFRQHYYNQIKLQLLEKQVPFEEEMVKTGSTDPAVLERTPMGKVPFLDTGVGCISESLACAEYIEAQYPQHALLPSDPFAAAKVRELVLHRTASGTGGARLYAEACLGGKTSDATKEHARKLLVRRGSLRAAGHLHRPGR